MNLSTLIQHAVSSSNPAIQKEAEQKLIEYLTADSQNFFFSLSQIIGSQNESDLVRQAAGTIISRNIFNMTEDGLQYKWLAYQSAITQQIKSTLLATLGSDKQLPKRSASDAISKIAAIDVPLGKWNQLISALLNAANDSQVKNQKTAIMALGFVCIQFKQHKIAITHTQTQQIFTAIFIGLTNEHIQIKKEALIALTPCIIYVTEIFKNQKFREKTVTILLQCLRCDELVQHTLQVFLQYSKFYYVYLGQIIQFLYSHTQVIIQSKGPNTIIAMQLWHTIAETYLQKKGSSGIQNYILSLGDKLVKLLLTSLLYVDKGDDNNIRDSALSTLFPIAQGSEAVCMQSVSSFVGNGIKSQDWKFRQAAVMAFSTLTTSDNKIVRQWLEQGCDQFFNLLQDQDEFVVQSTLIGLIKILETSSNVIIILKKKNYKDYITLLTKLLNRDEIIVTRSLDTLGKLTQPLAQHPTLDLTNNPFDLINIITQFMMKTPVPSYRQLQSASIVVVHLLQGNKSNKINKQYTEFLVIESSKLRENVEQQNNLKMCFFVILHTAILSGKDPIDTTQSQAISALVHNHFQVISSVDQDGLYIIGALALRMGQTFVNHFTQFSPYITHGLGLKKQPATYKICLGVVCDIVKAIRMHIPNQLQSYLTTFISQFQAQGDRNTKGSLITGIGDLIRDSCDSNLIAKYKAQIIQIAQLSVSACIHLSSSNEDTDYAEQLKQILTDFLECLCSGFGNQTCINQVPDVLEIAMTFVLRTCNRQSNPTLTHFTKGLYLVFDVGSILVGTIIPGQIGPYYHIAQAAFQKPQFITIFNSLRDVPFNNEIKGICSYGRAVFGALKISNGVRYL